MALKPTRFPNGIDIGAGIEQNGEPMAAAPVPAPTEAVRGGVLMQPAIANLAAAPTESDFNGLLAALRAAGVLSST